MIPNLREAPSKATLEQGPRDFMMNVRSKSRALIDEQEVNTLRKAGIRGLGARQMQHRLRAAEQSAGLPLSRRRDSGLDSFHASFAAKTRSSLDRAQTRTVWYRTGLPLPKPHASVISMEPMATSYAECE